jgi:hypothetical protein
LNPPAAGCDQAPTPSRERQTISGAEIIMQNVRPENADPLPMRSSAPRVGTIMVRFVGLLIVIVAALALVWSR